MVTITTSRPPVTTSGPYSSFASLYHSSYPDLRSPTILSQPALFFRMQVEAQQVSCCSPEASHDNRSHRPDVVATTHSDSAEKFDLIPSSSGSFESQERVSQNQGSCWCRTGDAQDIQDLARTSDTAGLLRGISLCDAGAGLVGLGLKSICPTRQVAHKELSPVCSKNGRSSYDAVGKIMLTQTSGVLLRGTEGAL